MATDDKRTISIITRTVYEADHGEDVSAVALTLASDLMEQDGVVEVTALPTLALEWGWRWPLDGVLQSNIFDTPMGDFRLRVAPMTDSENYIWELMLLADDGTERPRRIGIEGSQGFAMLKGELALASTVTTLDNSMNLNLDVSMEDTVPPATTGEDPALDLNVVDVAGEYAQKSWGMFSTKGNILLGLMVGYVATDLADGLVPNMDSLNGRVRALIKAVELAGFSEIHDMAVREAIYCGLRPLTDNLPGDLEV